MKTSTFFLGTAVSCGVALTNAFLVPSATTTSRTTVRAMPDEPGNWFRSEDSVSGSVAPMPQRERGYEPRGRDYYPETQQQPPPPQQAGPDQWTPGPIQESRPWGAGYGVDMGRLQRGDEVVQGGGSRKTWETSHHDKTVVQISSEGRPIYTTASVWEGPSNTPASMRLYSEDGATRPWNAAFQNTNRAVGSSVLDLRNTGPMEFPLDVSVVGKHDGSKGMTKQEKDQQVYQPSPDKITKTVQGQSLSYFNVKAGVAAVMVELHSEGRPMYAQVELWQGPSDIKQCAEIYSDNGSDRVWSAQIETHGRECTVAIRNVGPAMVYPIKASVDPLF